MPELKKEIGRGQFGVVYSTDSEWYGSNNSQFDLGSVRSRTGTDKKMEIAIKAMVPQNDRQWGDLAQEYYYMKYWIGNRHRNIMQVLGVRIRV